VTPYVPKPRTGPRGFAAMTPERRAEISSKGGKRAHELGTGHQFTWAEACRAGRLGGEKISQDREHMAKIGRKGGMVNGDRRAEEAQNRRLYASKRGAEKEFDSLEALTAEDSPID
jgi:general stress protein YciG